MNPITVRVYDHAQFKVTTKFLDMGTSSSCTAEALFNTIDTRLSTCFKPMAELHIMWSGQYISQYRNS